MIFHQNTRLPAGKMVGAIVLAAVLGMLLPLITLAQITLLLPVLMLGGLFAVYLQCYGGPAPACTFLAVGLISAGWLTGSTLMWILLAASLLPAAPLVFGISRKQPFFEQLRNAIVFYALGLLAALLIAYGSFGSGMIAKLMDAIRSEFARMPDAAFRPFVDAINSALGASGLQGFGAFTVQTYRAQLSGVLDLMQRTYAQTLPGTLLSGVVLSGTLSVLWGNWTLARRGMSTNESFIGMIRWFLPARITALLMCLSAFPLGLDGRRAFATVRRDHANHLSPNCAWSEAAAAGALGVKLGGDHEYFGQIVRKPAIGDDLRVPEGRDIRRMNLLMFASAGLMLALIAGAGRLL